jgi:hypothetical protein
LPFFGCDPLKLIATDLREQVNEIFENTGTTIKASIIVEDVDSYSPPGDPFLYDELNWVKDPAGWAAGRRNANNADVVFLQVVHPTALVGGISVIDNFCLCEEFAFGVFESIGNAFNLNLSHELGHIMGMQHDRILMWYPPAIDCTPGSGDEYACPSSTPHKSPYIDSACNCGMVLWDKVTHIHNRTIMASPNLCRYLPPANCKLPQPVYSHAPLFGTTCSSAAGVLWSADNKSQLIYAADFVALFR